MKQKLILQSLVMDTDVKSKLRAAKSEFLNEQLQNILIQERNEEILLVMLKNKAITANNILQIKDILGIEETEEEKNIKINKIKDLNKSLEVNVKREKEHFQQALFLSQELSSIQLDIERQLKVEEEIKSILYTDIEEYNYLFLEDIIVPEEKNKNIINITEVKESTVSSDIFSLNKKEENLKGKLLERFL
jgi:hypothetical protein